MPLLAGSVADLARAPELRVALDWFRRERAWINDQHLKLWRVPAPTFLEQKRAEWMAERFQSLGWESRLDRSGNVVAALPGRRDSATVAVTAHLDTVLAPRSPDDVKISNDGRLLGPGVSDHGAGLAAHPSAGRERRRGRRGQSLRNALPLPPRRRKSLPGVSGSGRPQYRPH